MPYSFFRQFVIPPLLVCKAVGYIHVISFQMSSLLIMLISINRFLVVKFPLQASIWLTKRRTLILLMALVLFCIVFQSYAVFSFGLVNGDRCAMNTESSAFLKVMSLLSITCNSVVPYLVVIVMNVLIIRQLKQQRKFRYSGRGKSLNQQSAQNEKDKDKMSGMANKSEEDKSTVEISDKTKDNIVDKAREKLSDKAKKKEADKAKKKEADKAKEKIADKANENMEDKINENVSSLVRKKSESRRRRTSEEELTLTLLIVTTCFIILTLPLNLRYVFFFWLLHPGLVLYLLPDL